jgi:hypothetical protein
MLHISCCLSVLFLLTFIQKDSTNDNLMNSLVYAQIFNDERDLILAKWNQLQAFYGTGKIFYQNMVIDVQEDNRLTRFKVFVECFISEGNTGFASTEPYLIYWPTHGFLVTNSDQGLFLIQYLS